VDELQTFIGVKMIEARPMNYFRFKDYKKQSLGPEDKDQPGYLVRYPDGYESWSPKDVFEAAYFPLEQKDSISELDVEFFLDVLKTRVETLGEKTTILKAETITGFTYVEGSSCVDPKNYNKELGAKICHNRVRDQVWEHLGFVLQWAKNGLHRG